MPIKKSPNPALTKAYEKATGEGPIETTLELTEAEIKRMIRAADKLILDAADTAKKIPATAVNAAKTVVDAGLDGAKAAGKSWLGAVKALGKMFGGDFAPGSFASSKPAPTKRPERGPGGTPPKPRKPDSYYDSMRPAKIKPSRPGETLPPTL